VETLAKATIINRLLAASCQFIFIYPHVGMLSSRPFVLLQGQKHQEQIKTKYNIN